MVFRLHWQGVVWHRLKDLLVFFLCSFHALHSEIMLFDFLLGEFANVTDSFASNGTDFVASVLLYLDQESGRPTSVPQ